MVEDFTEIHRVVWFIHGDRKEKCFFTEPDACKFVEELKDGFNKVWVEWDGKITQDSLVVY